MNVKPGRRAALAVAVAMLSCSMAVRAGDLVLPLADPLHTMPAVIGSGVVLPGDVASTSCPVLKDFSAPLALSEAVDLALCNNSQIRAAWASIKVQAAGLGQARAAYLPTASATLGRINDRTRYPDTGFAAMAIQSSTANGAITWRIFDFGERAANREAAENLLAAALATHESVVQRTLTMVIQAYFDAITARALANAKAQSKSIATETLDSATRREAKGVEAQSAKLQATTALAKASLEERRADGAYRKALSVLVYVLGVPTSTVVLLPDTLSSSSDDQARNLAAWLDVALTHHPALAAARTQLDAAKNQATAARAGGLPTIDFSGNYYQNGRPGQTLTPTKTQETTVGLLLTIPIFDGFSRTYKVRGAQAQAEQKEAELADTEQQVLMEVVKAHADAESALQNLQASETLLAAAQDSFAASHRRYDKGAADILEMLNTQSLLSDAQQERIRCLAEWHSSRLRLLASAGMLGRSAIAK
jgi:outer membrane protein